MIKPLSKFVGALNSNVKPSDIAHGLCIGLVLGFVPKTNLLWYLLFVFFMFVRINKGGYLVMTALGSLIAPLLDGLFDKIGYAILTQPKLSPAFARLIDIPFVGFTKFNNTIVSGSLAFGLLCYIPFFALLMLLIKKWRKYIAPVFNNSKIAKLFYKLPLLSKIAQKASEMV